MLLLPHRLGKLLLSPSSSTSPCSARRCLAAVIAAAAMPPRACPKAVAAAAKKRDAVAAPEEAAEPREKRQKRPAAAAKRPAPAAAAAAKPAAPSNYWLVKSEPSDYSVDDLAEGKGNNGQWDGVRNFVARNNMRAMAQGDLCLFYHSSCAVPACVAVARVTSREAYPDPTASLKGGKYYDPKHTAEAPRWYCVDLALERRLRRPVTLHEIKRRAAAPGGGGSVLAAMALLTRPRLSVQPVTAAEWAEVMAMEAEEAPAEEGEGGKKR